MDKSFHRSLEKKPLSLNVYVLLLIIFFSLLVGLLLSGQYAKKEEVTGIIRNGAYFRISSNKSGVVSQLYVKEGDTVKTGDPLLKILLPYRDIEENDDNRMSFVAKSERLNQQLNIKDEEEKRITKEEKNNEEQKQKTQTSMAQMSTNLDQLIVNQANKVAILNEKLRNYRTLQKNNLVARNDVEELRLQKIEQESALTQTRIERNRLEKEKAEKALYFSQLERELARAKDAIQRDKHNILEELNNLQGEREYIITSPMPAVVEDLGVVKGDVVDSNSAAVILRDPQVAHDPIAVLYLTSSQIGLINTDTNIFLRVDTFPYETYGVLTARITHIANTPSMLATADSDDQKKLFRARAVILRDGKNNSIPYNYLTDGMTFQTSISQPPISLWEWLFIPVKKGFKRNPEFFSNEAQKVK